MGYKIAVAGATDNLGREILDILAEREFPADEVIALGPRRSIGSEVSFGDRDLKVRDIDSFDFAGCDMALFALDTEAARKYAPLAADAGCIVIDSSDAFRMDPSVPLVVPEVNARAIEAYRERMVVACPDPATAELVAVLKPLHERARIRRVVVSTYQSLSGAGKEAMDELWNQTKGLYVPGQEVAPHHLPRQIAFNIIPQVGEFMEDGSSRAEWQIMAETKKILDRSIRLAVTSVRVPSFVGDAESVNIEFEDFLDEDEARDILRESPGLLVVDKHEDGGYVTPVESVGEFATFVSRIRQDSTVENGLSLWIVADNLRKGSALNLVQVAEILGRDYLQKG
ncbi:aspartate-semialdehyde dehydrogenase [Paracoccus aerodenitrificans]|uniref:aspartate-semialdehyde dehydrogenase n=1 Tax=Paracoccus aerodenitrificans TaxID=3017781 RepID=UPI0022F09030|nr:aspartate-semialdehyde dehydrogenase [Paracoccus aerodenitrificans]WBU64055.1 aspartate-semialdehyde dehydrogenase [Paracoccus aerodenitrificans]